MFYVRRGKGVPPVVFIHGFGCAHEDWDRQVAVLERRVTTIAVDLRGHGRTPGTAGECRIGTYGRDVTALISEVGLGPAIIVGHSMGCRVVLEVARVAPEAAAGLALVDGSRFGEVGSGADHVLAAHIAEVGYRTFVRRFVAGMFTEGSDGALAERVIERALRLPADLGTELIVDAARWDVERCDAALARVQVPVLAVQSTSLDAERRHVPLRKGQTTPYLDLLRSRIADCSLAIIAGVRHFSQLEAPGAVTRHLQVFIEHCRRAMTRAL